MFLFVMLGITFERQIGTRQFLWLYFVAGVVGGAFEVLFNLFMYMRHGPVALNPMGDTFLTLRAVGASAGVAGILIAFAVVNPRAQFLLFFLIPIQARWIALFYVLIETRHVLLGLTEGWTDQVAHAAHFGGMAVGFLWMRFGAALRFQWRTKSRAGPPGPDRIAGEDDQAEMDRILRKIHEHGIDSLTLRERMFLQDASRRRGGR
jgi:membrane associated rhomboid family serine protease